MLGLMPACGLGQEEFSLLFLEDCEIKSVTFLLTPDASVPIQMDLFSMSIYQLLFWQLYGWNTYSLPSKKLIFLTYGLFIMKKHIFVWSTDTAM